MQFANKHEKAPYGTLNWNLLANAKVYGLFDKSRLHLM